MCGHYRLFFLLCFFIPWGGGGGAGAFLFKVSVSFLKMLMFFYEKRSLEFLRYVVFLQNLNGNSVQSGASYLAVTGNALNNLGKISVIFVMLIILHAFSSVTFLRLPYL